MPKKPKIQGIQLAGNKIGIVKSKIKVPEFCYKKAGEKQETTYQGRDIECPDKPGDIVRVYLEKDGTISTKDGDEHELILAEVEIPHVEYETVEIGEKGKEKTEQRIKAVDLNSLFVKNFEIPKRS